MILDHIDKLQISDEDSNGYAIATLGRLSQSLFWLFDEVNKTEQSIRKNASRENVSLGIINGVLKNVPTNIPVEWMSSAFQWYAVSACNYAQLVGWLVC